MYTADLTMGAEQFLSFLSPTVVWGFFAGMSILLGIVSIALIYHWVSYSYKRPKVIQAAGMYIVGLLGLLGIAAYFTQELIALLS